MFQQVSVHAVTIIRELKSAPS